VEKFKKEKIYLVAIICMKMAAMFVCRGKSGYTLKVRMCVKQKYSPLTENRRLELLEYFLSRKHTP